MLYREAMPPRYEPVETWERRPGAATAPLGGYRRREPEKTLLHQVVRGRLEPFLASARERSATGRGLPSHVDLAWDPPCHLDLSPDVVPEDLVRRRLFTNPPA